MDLLARICSSGKLKFRFFLNLKCGLRLWIYTGGGSSLNSVIVPTFFFVDQTLGYAYPGPTGAQDKQSRICLSRGNLEAI